MNNEIINKGPVAIKTKKTMRLSRGFLAFILIFGLSAALTSEAKRRGKNKSSPRQQQRTERQSMGQQPTKNIQSIEIKYWSKLIKWSDLNSYRSDLNSYNKAFTNALQTLKSSQGKDLSFFLKEVSDLSTSSDFRFEKSNVFGEAIKSILTGVARTNGSGNTVLVLETVVSMARYLEGQDFDSYVGSRKIRSVSGFLQRLSSTVENSPWKTLVSRRKILEATTTKYNRDINHNGAAISGRPLSLEVIFDSLILRRGKEKVLWNFGVYPGAPSEAPTGTYPPRSTR